MAMDKKVKGGKIRLVLLDAIGRAAVSDDYPRDALEALLEERTGA
jgi:3-dehydroquinate synthase